METINLNILATDYNRLLIGDYVKFFMKFESAPIIDEISEQTLQLFGDRFPFIERAENGNGLRMRPNRLCLFLCCLVIIQSFRLVFG